jgi:FkbH-like protein
MSMGVLDSTVATGEMVDELFQAILGRSLGNEQVKAGIGGSGTVKYWVKRLIESDEFFLSYTRRRGIAAPSKDYVTDEEFRNPCLTPFNPPAKILVVGSCLLQDFKLVIEGAHAETQVVYRIFNNASELEDMPESELNDTTFQITQIPFRSLVFESEYYSLRADASGAAEWERLFQRATERLRRNLDAALKYNRQNGLTTFVLNFARPQSNALGILAPKYDLSNFSYFVGELNRALYEMLAAERGVYMIDFDEIAGSLGKRYILDDSTSHLNHASFLRATNFENDIDLTPYGSIDDIFAPRLEIATLAIFRECVAAHRVLSPASKIKLVIFDLDGTLWRGVAAEDEDIGGHLNEGWPLGVLEAAAFLRKRGVLLAIASKNDPEIASRIWAQLYGAVFPLSNFVSVKFSWGSKTESIAEILRETNLLAGNALFVDDNPVERERARLAFPELRLLEGPIATWRRTLLWSAELQVPYITEESVGREESIRNMAARETLRDHMSEAEYLESLAVETNIAHIESSSDPGFKRAFELLNKTNQFNTTGRRWKETEMERFFARGGRMLAARVSDRFSDYGLTALLLCLGSRCEQMVMSCRVFGLGVEFRLFEAFKASAPGPYQIAWKATAKNGPAKTFLQRSGALDSDALQTPEQSDPILLNVS